MHHMGAVFLISFLSSRFLSLIDIVPCMVPKAKVCPSGDQAEHNIFSLYFSFGMSCLPGVNRAKSPAPPTNSSCVNGLNESVRTESLRVNLRCGSIFLSASKLNFHKTHVLSVLREERLTIQSQTFSHLLKMLCSLQVPLLHYGVSLPALLGFVTTSPFSTL